MSQQQEWHRSARFYQFYPLGFARDEAVSGQGLARMQGWLSHVQEMAFDALYLAPVWHSHDHGYETIDYCRVDPRLGDNQSLKAFVDEAHRRGIRVVLDGVFNHVGRGFFAFQDLLAERENSRYVNWFVDINFNADNHHGDGLSYACWEGHESLVKLNVTQPEVQAHLLSAVDFWIREFGIDGLRLDAADCVDPQFWRALRRQCDSYPDFWLMGEIIHGDYRQWLHGDGFHAVTNYEVYKGLWSSFNDVNMHEIAWSLQRQFAEGGIYQGQCLYNFVDNHDVARIASTLSNPAHMVPLYLLLYLIPGLPAVYYGSEWLAEGKKERHDDWHLRPSEPQLVYLSQNCSAGQHHKQLISRLNRLRQALPQLAVAGYRQLTVTADLLAFERGDNLLCVVNGASRPQSVTLPTGRYRDLLNQQEVTVAGTGAGAVEVSPCWGRVLVKC